MKKKSTFDKLEINEINLTLLVEEEYKREKQIGKKINIIKKIAKILGISLAVLLISVYIFAIVMMIVNV